MKKNIFILLLLLESITSNAQQSSFYLSQTAEAAKPVLDQLRGTSAAAAYSLRKLRASYIGAAIRVRRSSDNAEQDIGFTLAGDLDTVSLIAFCGLNTAFVTTWYDQSGNNNNLTQSQSANQPQIVTSGTIFKVNNRPAVKFIQASNTMLSGSIPGSLAAITRNVVANFTGSSSFAVSGSASPRAYILDNGTINMATTTIGSSLTGINIITGTITGQTSATVTRRRNGLTDATLTGQNRSGSNPTIAVGALALTNGPSNASVSEIVHFNIALSDNTSSMLERNQGRYYLISVN